MPKLVDMTALAAPDDGDLLYVVHNPAGTASGRKTTIAELRAVAVDANPATAIGDTVKALAVYDSTGTLVGYVPVYIPK